MFPLGGVDIILGIAWLATLGDVQVNWATMRMSFQLPNESVTSIGNASNMKALISEDQLHKMKGVNYFLLLWDISSPNQAPKFEIEIIW